ncbi:hypothetical protein [Catenulispora pinisilvae]|uniref:hypothetical protein n=1 Tax=Catenulispora pinisilvae TaxID=2705253 RepID=UPI001891167E|nr:hypothetical protein [Catenulispora pinisilvae]
MTQPEFASLIVLMSGAQALTNPQLKELAGFDLTGKERRTLNDLGLVRSRKQGRAFTHELTADGWLVCRDLLAAAERPARAGSFGGALFAVLAGLGAALNRRDLDPRQFFDPSRAEDSSGPATTDAASAVESAAADPAEVEWAIRTAYGKLAATGGDWVGLAPLRAHLAVFAPSEIDAALRQLARRSGVHIIPVANLKSLTEADRLAALRLGGQDCHALAIEAE